MKTSPNLRSGIMTAQHKTDDILHIGIYFSLCHIIGEIIQLQIISIQKISTNSSSNKLYSTFKSRNASRSALQEKTQVEIYANLDSLWLN